MPYMIVMNSQTSEVLFSRRTQWSLARPKVRAQLCGLYPGADTYAPREAVPIGRFVGGRALTLTVYLSHNKEGIGRVGLPLQTWIVIPKEKLPERDLALVTG